MHQVVCLHCRTGIHPTLVDDIGTQWIHDNGAFECPVTYAAPLFPTCRTCFREKWSCSCPAGISSFS